MRLTARQLARFSLPLKMLLPQTVGQMSLFAGRF
jgi:hypothetical protein